MDPHGNGETAPMGSTVQSDCQKSVRLYLAQNQNPSSIVSLLYFEEANGRTIAHWYPSGTYSRKVRAPVDRLPGNAWARTARAVRDGKCHRKQTAILTGGKGETVG